MRRRLFVGIGWEPGVHTVHVCLAFSYNRGQVFPWRGHLDEGVILPERQRENENLNKKNKKTDHKSLSAPLT